MKSLFALLAVAAFANVAAAEETKSMPQEEGQAPVAAQQAEGQKEEAKSAQ